MQTAAMRDTVRDRTFEVSPSEFEVLCKMVLVRKLDTESLRVTAFQNDAGIDIEGIIDEELLRARLGVQVKRYAEGNSVGLSYIQRFDGALRQGNHQIGTHITTSSYTSGAIDAADSSHICLVDGERLAELMVEHEIGVERTHTGCELDPEFWAVFEEPERDDQVPTIEVPLADSFDTLRRVLEAIDTTDGSKHKITEYVRGSTGDSFSPRHADLYATAGWLLGFAHKETPVVVDGREQRRWGLTRSGVEYLELLVRGDDEVATELLVSAIANVEIVSRARDALYGQGRLTRDQLVDVLETESELSRSSANRRASTVKKWLAMLPDVEERRDGRQTVLVRV
ncbi:restriction endonuclease [Haladaptatus sp. NG-SE-30]